MNRLKPDDADVRFMRRLILVIVIAAVTAAFYLASDLLILAFGSMLGAIVIHAIADLYHDRAGLSDRISLGLAIVTVLAVIGLLGWLFGVQFREQVNILITRLPGLIGDLSAYLSQSPVGAKLVAAVQAAYAGSQAAQDVGGLVRGTGELALNCLLLLVGALFFAANPTVYERGFCCWSRAPNARLRKMRCSMSHRRCGSGSRRSSYK